MPEKAVTATLGSYVQFLRTNRAYRQLWLGEAINLTGAWFSYVATLTVVERHSQGRGLLLSVVIVLRMLPSSLWCAVAGAVADRCNRVQVLVWACIGNSIVVSLFPLVNSSSRLWLLYVLVFVQFSVETFYEPARKALVPMLVPKRDLALATTLDSFCWSLTGAAGAALGGYTTSLLGTSACFWLDSCTFLVAAALASRLQVSTPGGVVIVEGPKRDLQDQATAPLEDRDDVSVAMVDIHSEQGLPTGISVNGMALSPERQPFSNGTPQAHRSGLSPVSQREGGLAVNSVGPLSPGKAFIEADERRTLPRKLSKPALAKLEGPLAGGAGSQSLGASVTAAWRSGLSAIREGWTYIHHPDNHDVAALSCIKATGAMCWGVTDILNVKFSELPEMQSLGPAEATMGIIYGTVGLGCFIGPILLNSLTPAEHVPLLRGVALAMALLLLGYLIMLNAIHVVMLIAATFVRAMGSSTLWIYSTLILQLRVDNAMLGRVMAMEAALYTLVQSAMAMLGGTMLDALGLTIHEVVILNVGLATMATCGWVGYWLRARHREAQAAAGGKYTALQETADHGADQD